ncbi:MAG: T9SS type A sorting domain-containing protein, partial [Bacteroidota bacterium]
MFFVKYDPSGNVLWAKSAGGTSYDEANSVTADASGNIIAAGFFKSPTITFGSTTLTNTGNSPDMFIVKLSSSTGINEWTIDNLQWSVFPNPTSGKVEVRSEKLEVRSIEITNLLGEKVFQSQYSIPNTQYLIDLSSQPNGIYFLTIKTSQGTANKKLIINK